MTGTENSYGYVAGMEVDPIAGRYYKLCTLGGNHLYL